MLFNINHDKQSGLGGSQNYLEILKKCGAEAEPESSDLEVGKPGVVGKKNKGLDLKVLYFFFYTFAFILLPKREIFFVAGKNWLKLKFSKDNKDVLARHFGGQNGNLDDFAETTMTDLYADLAEKCSFDPNHKVDGRPTFREDPSDENLIERFKAFLWNRVYFSRLSIVCPKEGYEIVDFDSVDNTQVIAKSNSQLSEDIKDFFMELSELDRIIFELKFYNGYSHPEIAEIINKTMDDSLVRKPFTEGNSRKRYHHTIGCLRERLSK